MEKKFKVGDKVKLKSGIPEMTVTGYFQQKKYVGEGRMLDTIYMETTKVNVVYFDNAGKEQKGCFEEDALELLS
ncbi:MAG: DUF2158 domain-containing protein [Bacteroidetes bacterium]|nr:DUF2158 domain-containing protein [Bacteroidota bacterium]